MYRLKKRFKNEKGQGMVEYGLILALVSIVSILVLGTLGGNIKGQLEGVTNSMGVSAPDSGIEPGDPDLPLEGDSGEDGGSNPGSGSEGPCLPLGEDGSVCGDMWGH